MVDEEDQKEDKFDFDSAGEAVGYISMAQARVLAMRTARDEPGSYGAAYEAVDMVFDTVGEEEDEDYYVVTLSLRPEGDFVGTPGREQFFIEKQGVVHRQVLDLPEPERRRRFPMVLWVLAAVVVMVAVLLETSPSGEVDVALAVLVKTVPAEADKTVT